MNIILVTLSMTCLVTLTLSHLCLLSPPQRGSLIGLNLPGADNCLQFKPPCGEWEVQNDTQMILKTGQHFVLIFQKNKDHTLKERPGFFIVRMFPADKEEHGVQILEIQDTNQNNIHIYVENIIIPSNMTGHVILQVQFHTNNPYRGPVFYQCADLEIIADGD